MSTPYLSASEMSFVPCTRFSDEPFCIYNSKQFHNDHHNLESFSSDAGINVIIINVQAFNAKGKITAESMKSLMIFKATAPLI